MDDIYLIFVRGKGYVKRRRRTKNCKGCGKFLAHAGCKTPGCSKGVK
jgi:hypothetical protein